MNKYSLFLASKIIVFDSKFVCKPHNKSDTITRNREQTNSTGPKRVLIWMTMKHHSNFVFFFASSSSRFLSGRECAHDRCARCIQKINRANWHFRHIYEKKEIDGGKIKRIMATYRKALNSSIHAPVARKNVYYQWTAVKSTTALLFIVAWMKLLRVGFALCILFYDRRSHDIFVALFLCGMSSSNSFDLSIDPNKHHLRVVKVHLGKSKSKLMSLHWSWNVDQKHTKLARCIDRQVGNQCLRMCVQSVCTIYWIYFVAFLMIEKERRRKKSESQSTRSEVHLKWQAQRARLFKIARVPSWMHRQMYHSLS